MSSPGDTALLRKKKRLLMEQNTKVKKQPEMMGNAVQMCEEGLSPKITFKKNMKYADEDDD